jgi:hypothetical protein
MPARDNPMHRTRSGVKCKAPAMSNGRCRMQAEKERMRRANTRHGIYSEERRRLMEAVRKLVREARQTAEET